MNLRCKVCGEKAAGFHFGAFTCEGCKSFFGRCCNNTSIIGECRNNKECIIDKKNRTSCKACRLQKCLLVGMSKSGSRYGRRSNWFKQYFQENEHHDETQSAKKSQSDQHENCNVALGSIKQLKKLDRTSPFSVVKADLYRKKISDVESHNKIPFDLSPTQPLISSHLYLNYFPHLGLNRLVTYKQSVAGENAFYIPHSIPFTTSFNPENNAKDYYEKLVITRVQNSELSDTINDDDPLDLSQKQTKKERINSFGHEVESDFSKKALPLDLSVK